jgi:hypothetical protein
VHVIWQHAHRINAERQTPLGSAHGLVEMVVSFGQQTSCGGWRH